MVGTGPAELVVALITLVVLGPRRLPSAGRSLGTGMREFRDAVRGEPAASPSEPGMADGGLIPPVFEEPARG